MTQLIEIFIVVTLFFPILLRRNHGFHPCQNRIGQDIIAKLSEGYGQEQAALKQSIEDLSSIVHAARAQAVDVQSFLKIVRKYTAPAELTPALLREFVEKLVVHAPDKPSGHRIQRIDVHYNFIGEVDFSPEFRR